MSGSGGVGDKGLPQKRFYRARAHSNPFSDSQFPVPLDPSAFHWSLHFPSHPTAAPACTAAQPATDNCEAAAEEPQVRFADVGCGFGGLLVKLSPLFPQTLMVGMELRDKVSEYVKERVDALRQQHPGQYGNITAIRTNAMKYLPNYFRKGQLEKMFFLFPDPHFKEKNHRRRIITSALLAEYAYVMAVGGVLYTITDVEELGLWMDGHLAAHPLFHRIPEEELESDPVVPLLVTSSEEGLKVERNGGKTYRAVYRRIVPEAADGA